MLEIKKWLDSDILREFYVKIEEKYQLLKGAVGKIQA